MTPGCVFCRIVSRESPAEIEFEDEEVLAFKDLYPKAPVHLLIIPKRHIESIARVESADEALVGHCVRRLGYGERGYRVSCNTGPEGGQVVYHLHLHLTAGRRG